MTNTTKLGIGSILRISFNIIFFFFFKAPPKCSVDKITEHNNSTNLSEPFKNFCLPVRVVFFIPQYHEHQVACQYLHRSFYIRALDYPSILKSPTGEASSSCQKEKA